MQFAKRYLCTLLVTAVALSTIAATRPQFTPGSVVMYPLYDPNSEYNQGLVAWWLYYPKITSGNIWRNIVDNSYPMTLTNTAALPTATSGFGQGTLRRGGFGEVRLDGTNDYAITNGASTKYSFPDTVFAVELWFRTTASATQQWLISNQLVAASQGGWVARIETSNLIVVRLLTNTNSRALERDTVSTISTNIWHHLVLNFTTNTTVQASNEIGIILDGVQDQSARVEGSAPYSVCGCEVRVGIQGDNTSSPFAGMVDNVKIYKRLLSVTEARQHMLSDMRYADMQLNDMSIGVQNKLAAGGGGNSKGNFIHWFLP